MDNRRAREFPTARLIAWSVVTESYYLPTSLACGRNEVKLPLAARPK